MRKILAVLAATLIATPALADWNGHRHGHHQRNHYYQNRGGVDPGLAIFGAIVGGLMVNQMMQPQRQYYQPMCQTVFLGRVWNGYTWVEQYQRICD
jgi:hypothetical protein